MNADFVKAIALLAKEKGISPDILYSAVEEALITAYKKNYGSAQNVRVSMHKETGEIHVYARKNIVEEVTDPTTEISLADAQKLNSHYQAGDILDGSHPQELRPHCCPERQAGDRTADPGSGTGNGV